MQQLPVRGSFGDKYAKEVAVKDHHTYLEQSKHFSLFRVLLQATYASKMAYGLDLFKDSQFIHKTEENP